MSNETRTCCEHRHRICSLFRVLLLPPRLFVSFWFWLLQDYILLSFRSTSQTKGQRTGRTTHLLLRTFLPLTYPSSSSFRSLSLSLQLIYGFFLSHCTSTKKMRVFSLVVFHSPRFGAFSLVKKLDNRTQQTNKQNRQHQHRQAVHIFFCITSLCVRACVCLYDIAKGCI